MTDLLEKAVIAARSLSPAAQDEIARVVLMMAVDDEHIYELTPDEIVSFAASRQQSARGEYAADEQVKAVWAKYDP